MPNWCEGTLRIRGKVKDIISFIENGTDGDAVKNEGYISATGNKWIKNTRRAFITDDYFELYYEEDELENKISKAYEFEQAWGISPDQLLEVAKKYSLDFWIKAYESGMQFSQEVKIVGGVIKIQKENKYKDWDWECECPNLGG